MVNVVDLMKLQPQREHPHGLSDTDFDALFTTDKPIIFAYHGYPWLIHRLTYRRTNHDNMHVRGYKEEGTITTPFDMAVLNDLDRFHLVMDTVDRVPKTGERGIYLKQQLKDKLIAHKEYIETYGEDLPEIRNWRWPIARQQPARDGPVCRSHRADREKPLELSHELDNEERRAHRLLTRDAILKLLSDAEVSSVSTAETEVRLWPGDEYLDLERLDDGVQRAGTSPVSMGRALPRHAVRAETWTKILAQLTPARR